MQFQLQSENLIFFLGKLFLRLLVLKIEISDIIEHLMQRSRCCRDLSFNNNLEGRFWLFSQTAPIKHCNHLHCCSVVSRSYHVRLWLSRNYRKCRGFEPKPSEAHSIMRLVRRVADASDLSADIGNLT